MKEVLLALPEPKAKREDIVPFYKATTRGVLVRRVKPDGTFIDGTTLLVTGAYVSSQHRDTEEIKFVHVRELVERNGQFEISPADVSLRYDPHLPVVKIGRIDYLKPENEEFFALVAGNRF